MARITSLNMLLETTGNDYLSELYGKVIENVMGNLTSAKIKNDDLSGDPTSGSVEAKRMAFAASKSYGTARAAHKGDSVKVKPVTVALDEDAEIVEELEEKDIKFYGVDGVLDRRANDHVASMVAELETAFYDKAKTAAGITFTPGSGVTAPIDVIEEAIQAVATVKNNFVKGCPRNKIAIVCSPAWYGKLRNYIDSIPAANVDSAAEEIKVLHGCEIYESVFLPTGQNFFVMAKGSIAQPVVVDTYTAEKIPLSNAYAVELFYTYGTKDVIPNSSVNPVTARTGAEITLTAINQIVSVPLTYVWSYSVEGVNYSKTTANKNIAYRFPNIEFSGLSYSTTLKLATFRNDILIGEASAPLTLYPPIATSINGTAITGQNVIIPITKNRANLYVKVIASYMSYTEVIAVIPSTSAESVDVNWMPLAENIAPLIPDQTTANVTVTVESYAGSEASDNYIGSLSYAWVVTLDDSIKGVSSLSVVPVNTNAIVDSWNIFIQGYSKVRTILTASTQYGTIKNGYITGKGINVFSEIFPIDFVTSPVINESGTFSFTGYAVDSRDRRTNEDTKTIDVFPYFKPSIGNVSIARCKADGTISDDGDYIMPTYTEVFASCDDHNILTCKLQYKTASSDTYEEINVISGTPIPGFDKQQSYDVRIKVTDSLTTDAAAYYSAVFKIPISTRVLNINANGKAMAIGGFSPNGAENKLDIFWQTDFKQNPTVNGQPIGGGSLGVKIQRGSDAITSSLKTITFAEEFTSVPTVVASYASTGTLASGGWASIKISSITTKGFKIAYGGSGTVSYPIDFIAIGV